MREEKRQCIVDEINDLKGRCNLLEEKMRKLNKLSNNKIIKRYFKLKDEISIIKEIMKENPTESILVDSCFKYYLSNMKECTHDICLYCGSYYDGFYYDEEDDGFTFVDTNTEVVAFECLDENDERFQYNKYHCIECGKTIEISKKDWETFEQKHTVLNQKNGNFYSEEYRQLLYENTFEKTKMILVKKYGVKKL